MSEIVWTGENAREVADFIDLRPDVNRDNWPTVRRIGLMGPTFKTDGQIVVAEPGDVIVREGDGFSVRKAVAA